MIDLSQPPRLLDERIVLVTMSRGWLDDQGRADLVHEALVVIRDRWPDAVLVHGDEPSGDRRVGWLWNELGCRDVPVPAQWDLCSSSCPRHRRRTRSGAWYCPWAGLRRNDRMVKWVAGQRASGGVRGVLGVRVEWVSWRD